MPRNDGKLCTGRQAAAPRPLAARQRLATFTAKLLAHESGSLIESKVPLELSSNIG